MGRRHEEKGKWGEMRKNMIMLKREATGKQKTDNDEQKRK